MTPCEYQPMSKDFQHFIAGTHGVIVHLASWAFFVAVPLIVPAEDSEPGTVPVVNKVFPAIRPNPLIPVPVESLFSANSKQRRGRKRLGLDPEILVTVANRAVG